MDSSNWEDLNIEKYPWGSLAPVTPLNHKPLRLMIFLVAASGKGKQPPPGDALWSFGPIASLIKLSCYLTLRLLLKSNVQEDLITLV